MSKITNKFPLWEAVLPRLSVQFRRTAERPEQSVPLFARSAACFSFRVMRGLAPDQQATTCQNPPCYSPPALFGPCAEGDRER